MCYWWSAENCFFLWVFLWFLTFSSQLQLRIPWAYYQKKYRFGIILALHSTKITEVAKSGLSKEDMFLLWYPRQHQPDLWCKVSLQIDIDFVEHTCHIFFFGWHFDWGRSYRKDSSDGLCTFMILHSLSSQTRYSWEIFLRFFIIFATINYFLFWLRMSVCLFNKVFFYFLQKMSISQLLLYYSILIILFLIFSS